MGIVGKQLNKRETKKLTAPVTAETSLTPDEVLGVIRGLQEREEAAIEAKVAAGQQRKTKAGRHFFTLSERAQRQHLYVVEHFEELRVSYGYPHNWTAVVKVVPRVGGSTVFVQLKNWKTKEEEMVDRKQFRQFMDDLAAALRDKDSR